MPRKASLKKQRSRAEVLHEYLFGGSSNITRPALPVEKPSQRFTTTMGIFNTKDDVDK